MPKRTIKASNKAMAAIICEDDKVHIRAGSTYISVTSKGIVENGKKSSVGGEDNTTHAGLTKGTMDLLNILPSMIVLPKPQRIPNFPIMPILSLVETAVWAAALGIALQAAGSIGR